MQAKKCILTSAALAMIICVCACGKKTGVEGKVVDGKGQGVAGVKVVAKQVQPTKGNEQFEAESGSDGSFTFSKLHPSTRYIIEPIEEDGAIAENVTTSSGPEGQIVPLPEPVVIHYAVSKDGVVADSAEVIAVKEVAKTVRCPSRGM